MKQYAVVVLLVLMGNYGWGQVSISNTTPITQNFDTMAATNNLPSNWKMHASTSNPTWTGASTSVTQQASSGSPTAGGYLQFWIFFF